MNHRCILPEQIEEVLTFSVEDARRKDAEHCPRCRSLLRQYSEFSTGKIEDQAEAAVVRPHLRRFIDQSIRRGEQPATGGKDNLWSRLIARFWPWPALATAAAAAAIVIFTLVPWEGAEEGGILLRGEDDATAGFTLLPPETPAAGIVRLSWTAVPAAEAYRVVVYNASFDEIFSSIVTDTAISVPLGDLEAGWQTAPTLQWEVEALRQGDVVSRSEPGTVQQP
jgi:hypothetical protein